VRTFWLGGHPPPPRKPADRELHGLGSGVYIGDGLVVTNNHVVEVQDLGSSKFRPMDEIKVITDHEGVCGACKLLIFDM